MVISWSSVVGADRGAAATVPLGRAPWVRVAVPPTKVWRAPAVWATILTMTERSEPADLADLRAERDALAARVAELERRRGIGVRLRRLAAPVLVVLFSISLLAAGLGVWLDRSTMNDDVWAERVVPLEVLGRPTGSRLAVPRLDG